MLSLTRCSELKLLDFIRPVENSTYIIHDPIRTKVNKVSAGFGHLREHKFRHSFADTLNWICAWTIKNECTEHFFLRCHNYISFQRTLMKELCDTDGSLVFHSFNDTLSVILYGDKSLNPCTNKRILTPTIKYTTNTQRFDQPLFSAY